MSKNKDTKPLAVCAFCDMGSNHDDAEDLAFIQKDDVAICSDCIAICIQAIARKATTKRPTTKRATKLTDLGLSKRALNILLCEDIDLERLLSMSEIDLLKIPGCGRGTTGEILTALYRDGGMR